MIKADAFTLRTLTEADLPVFHAKRSDVYSRGIYYPIDIPSITAIRKRYSDDGYWGPDNGLLLIESNEGALLGEILYFKPVPYWNAYEIAYLMYDPDTRGKGIMSEATRLLVRYLFETKLVNRLQLCIHPDNTASRRVAEKCGFTHEGTARGAWLNRGKYVSMEVYSILREDVID
jgi:ribosomal-protein-alanine N-acetyltransferase